MAVFSPRKRSIYAVCMLVLAPLSLLHGDEVILVDERSIQCTVLQENKDSIAILFGDALIRLDREQVLSIKKSTSDFRRPKATETGLPSYSDVLRLLVQQSWAVDLHQIPATVVEVGVLRHVPYKSHRVASECEINVYGDPSHPSCIEVGLFGKFVNHDIAKQRCVEFVASLFPDEASREVILSLSKDKDSVERDGLTFEITPATAEDAFGGWWISTYHTDSLDERRASQKELATITIERPRATRTTRASVPRVVKHDEDWESWHVSDFQHARIPAPSVSQPSSSGGRVYVRGYYRKDGTYVRPHTRSR
jgi:hypothetical protein